MTDLQILTLYVKALALKIEELDDSKEREEGELKLAEIARKGIAILVAAEQA